MTFVARNLLNRDFDVVGVIDDFGELIYREVDYRAEAANANKFTETYGHMGNVGAPRVLHEYTTSKVLVMEWVEGRRLTSEELTGGERKDMIDALVRCSCAQILQEGFFHADPHAGNLLCVRSGDANEETRREKNEDGEGDDCKLVYLDFGMFSYASPDQRRGFLLAVVHMINRDWPSLVKLFKNLGFIPTNISGKVIEDALEDALPNVLDADVSELNFKNVVNKLGDVFYTFPFSLPPFYTGVIRCLGVLEGVALQTDPSFRIISEAYPYIARQLLSDEDPEVKSALKLLVLDGDGAVRWDRLEGLLQSAKLTDGYDVVNALDKMSDYVLSDDGEDLAMSLIDAFADNVETLGLETLKSIDDQSVVLLRLLQDIADNADDISLPSAPESLVRGIRILSLLRVDSLDVYVPFARKILTSEKFKVYAKVLAGRVSERVIKNAVGAVFGTNEKGYGVGD